MDKEYITAQGRAAALEWQMDGHMSGRPVRREAKESLWAVRASYRRISRYAASGADIPPAAEWLLDNWYLACREGEAGADRFRGVKGLPALNWQGKCPRIQVLGECLVRDCGQLTGESILSWISGAQEVDWLSEEELSLVVPSLNLALLRRLERTCVQLERCLGEEETSLKALAQEMEEIFTAYRSLAAANLWQGLERIGIVEQTLAKDPAGIYLEMDDATRSRYRQEVSRLARKRGLSEGKTAQKALELAEDGIGEERHIGYYLFCAPLGNKKRTSTGRLYVCTIVLLTLVLALLLSIPMGWVAVLLVLPLSDIVKNTVDFLVVRFRRPRPVFRLSLKGGVPPEGQTVCVITALLTGENSGNRLAALLERYRLANRNVGERMLYGILADLPDSNTPMGEEQRRWVEKAAQAVRSLNETYGGGFYLFFRQPTFQSRDERYLGWERKRGALLELTRLLRGWPSGLRVEAGDPRFLRGTRYVITLDSDTRLNVGTAREMIGAMLHPLNRAKVDSRRRVVVRGYGILQPKVSVDLEAASKSVFARIYAGQGGIDPYGSATSDVYHDLFDQGTYTGKGIFDVDAFASCMEGRFPEHSILSHDLLEGSYLRAGFLGDVELTDGFPYQTTSWFDRMHRWVRGDWQASPWVRRRVRNEAGAKVENPISFLAKWKIFDNLRRALVPVFTLVALLLGLCCNRAVFGTAACVAVIGAASHLLLSGADLAIHKGRGARSRYHSRIVAGFGGAILQTLVQLFFLPVQAWVCLSATVTALWRMTVTHKEMLAWVTAADAERKSGKGLLYVVRKQWSAVVIGIGVALLAQFPGGRFLGLLWALSPLYAWQISKPVGEQRKLSREDRAFLLHEATLIWRYFDQWLREEDHWLPPDNVQELPSVGPARRTSPTNMGMALLCCLAAIDLDLTPRQRGIDLIRRILTSMEGLDRWQGHFYNWYNTATGRPMYPRYVSTVDSGNLCGCLIALREGLYELGEAELAQRAERLADEIRFRPLYDEDRKLFYIGYEVERGEFTKGWYDLLASEARQVSYIAVARGEVDSRHWRRLSRALVGRKGYSGMASWTGTMFEYFMPNLLMPCEPNSLLYESLSFCVCAQREAVGGKIPWGISESAFGALDGSQTYQYKAHGVQSLGLKRGLDRDLVIAPYASFLALALVPASAVANLRRLRDMGLEGKYGLYEAVDFTPSRLEGRKEFLPVYTFMVHHLGMSLLSIDNALRSCVMQERFMRDPSMGAYRELLQEKVPVGAQVMKLPRSDVPERVRVPAGKGWRCRGKGGNACHLLSNGAYSILLDSTGESVSKLGEIALTYGEEGVYFGLWRDGQLTDLFPSSEPEKVQWTFTSSYGELSIKGNNFTVIERIIVERKTNGELREITIAADEALEGELLCYLRPVLAPWRDYQAHPAFSRLSLQSQGIGDGVRFTRRGRSGGEELSAAVLWDCGEAAWDTNRERVLSRDGVLHGPKEGAVLDPCLCLRAPVNLKAGESFTLRVAIGVGNREESVLRAQALMALSCKGDDGILDDLLLRLELTREETLQAFQLLKKLRYAPDAGRFGTVLGQESLWPFGISGDDPILAMEVSEGEEETALRLARQHQLLRRCGFGFDLVYLIQSEGDYRQPMSTALRDGLAAWKLEGMLGARRGIYLVTGDKDARAAILGMAALVWRPGVLEQPDPEPILRPRHHFFLAPSGRGEARCRWTADGVELELNGGLPPLGWSHMMANPQFGWMTDETGSGYLWRDNARENQLTPWQNDPLAVRGPEALVLEKDGKEISLFAAKDGLPTRVTYGGGWARWDKQIAGGPIKLTAFVPLDIPARVFLIEIGGAEETETLCWRIAPRMANSAEKVPWVRWEETEAGVRITNPANVQFPGQTMGLLTSSAPVSRTVGRITLPAREKLVLVAGCWKTEEEERQVRTLCTWGKAEEALRRTKEYWTRLAGFLTVDTPNLALNHYLSFWCLYQTTACRLFGRTSLYQCGGAYGFRDQLQDVCALIPAAPELAREQILRACAHQFEEGDVQHWWHPTDTGEEKGVRTRISDDLLWLPYAISVWLKETGETDLLYEEVPFLSAPVLRREEHERYAGAVIGTERATVFQHGLRAVECSLSRGVGEHGLCLFGGGDWNDGMNLVGHKGKGESVWLTWFTAIVLERFSAVCIRMGDGHNAQRLQKLSRKLTKSAAQAWDGAWFLRGYYDDGTPLGSRSQTCCQIDSIAQSFSAFPEERDRELSRQAVISAMEQLVDKKAGLVKLLTPPFDDPDHDPGYIRGYLPGIRENGGQYTHGAVWLALACFELDMAEEGEELLRMLLPEEKDPRVYRAEPYVLAADVYAHPDHLGRGGWSWYTGGAGWYFRVAVQAMLGMRLNEGRLTFQPKLPAAWPGYQACWRTRQGELHITVERGDHSSVLLDGVPQEGGIQLNMLRGIHQVRVQIEKEAE